MRTTGEGREGKRGYKRKLSERKMSERKEGRREGGRKMKEKD